MRNLWRHWSKAQRLAAVIIITVGLVGIVWTYAAGTSETWQVLLETRLGRNSDELRELLARLDTEEIPWQLSQGAKASKFEIEVHSGPDYRRALLLASENGLVDEASGEGIGQGLFGSVTDTPEKSRIRLEQARSRKVEKAIRWHSVVTSVDLVIKHGKEGRFAADKDTPDTAVVLLRMKDSASRLDAKEAGSIRKIVYGSFGIKEENIQILDSNGRDYSEGSEGLEVLLARDLRVEVRSEICEVIEDLCLGAYEKEQFRLGVIVDIIEAQRSGREAKYKVNVNLVLDIGAVRQVLGRRDDLLEARGNPATTDFAARIDEYEREQEEFLARQLPLDNVRVTVNTEAFLNSQTEEAAAPPFFPGFFNRDWGLGWLSDPYIYGGGGLGLVFLLSCCLLGIRSRRKRRFETEVADVLRADACRDALLAVDQAGRLARNSPEVSTAVVKMWLSDSLDPVAEMSNPAAGDAESERVAAPSAN